MNSLDKPIVRPLHFPVYSPIHFRILWNSDGGQILPMPVSVSDNTGASHSSSPQHPALDRVSFFPMRYLSFPNGPHSPISPTYMKWCNCSMFLCSTAMGPLDGYRFLFLFCLPLPGRWGRQCLASVALHRCLLLEWMVGDGRSESRPLLSRAVSPLCLWCPALSLWVLILHWSWYFEEKLCVVFLFPSFLRSLCPFLPSLHFFLL